MSVYGWLIDAAGRQFPLDQSQSLRIGRDSTNSVVLNDASVSRSHAEIFVQGGIARIRDFGSSNGTFVNGMRVTESALYDGQSVRIGSVGFTYRGATNAHDQTILIGDADTVQSPLSPTTVQPLSGIFCQNCGASNRTGAAFCTKCGTALRAIRHAEVRTAFPEPQVQYIATSSANAGLAAVLSFFWCGLGHIYAGRIAKGILLMFLYPCFLAFGYLLLIGGILAAGSSASAGAGVFSLFGLVFLVLAGVVWVYGMVNSYHLAKGAAVATISRVNVRPV